MERVHYPTLFHEDDARFEAEVIQVNWRLDLRRHFFCERDVKYDFTADLTGTGDRSVYEVYDT